MPNAGRYARTDWSDTQRQGVIDAIAVGLTGVPLGERSNAAARDLLPTLAGNNDERTRAMAVFIARLPEVSLR